MFLIPRKTSIKGEVSAKPGECTIFCKFLKMVGIFQETKWAINALTEIDGNNLEEIRIA